MKSAHQQIPETILLNILGKTPQQRRRALWGLALIAPNTIGLFVFFGIPVLTSFATSLLEWNAIRPPVFVGVQNFQQLAQDAMFWHALRNTFFLLFLTVPTGVVLALGVAMLLNRKFAGRSFFRTIYFIPVVTSTVAASIVWSWIFQPRYGLMGNLLASFGLRDIAWLTRPDLVLFPIAIVTIWQRLGFDMILFLAGLQNIPRVLIEAAVIDGATPWQRFRHVTLPMLSSTTFLVMILSIINAFQIFDQVYIMTSRTTPGGVNGSATTLSFYMYQSAFVQSRFGYASSIALVLFMIILIITIFQLWLQRRWVYYESEQG